MSVPHHRCRRLSRSVNARPDSNRTMPPGAFFVPPDVRALRRALEPSYGSARDAADALAHAARSRAALADPLGAHARQSVPDAALREALKARLEVAVPGAAPLRLAPDTVSVACALADELYINEGHAAVLLHEARSASVRRSDKDTVGAAREGYFSQRRELVLFLQEVLRVHLLGAGVDDGEGRAAFVEAMGLERDALFAQCGLFGNLIARLAAGLPSLAMPTSANPDPRPPNRADSLANDEAVLLAECVFLLAYSVQLSTAEALSIRDLFGKVVALVASIAAEEDASSARVASHNHQPNGRPHGTATPSHAPHEPSRPISPVYARAQSVQNLIFLAWICSIDRTRYSDMYNPRTGTSGVNELLKDPLFTKQTCKLSPMPENEAENVSILPAIAAAELGGVLFRMAIQDPDQDEAVTTALRTCAFSDALEFLTADVGAWIEDGGGSLLPDANLYADVFEDFAFDLTEAPDLCSTLFQQTVFDLKNAASASGAHMGLDAPRSDRQSGLGTSGPPPRRSSLSTRGGKPPKPPPPSSSMYGPEASSSVKPSTARPARIGAGTGISYPIASGGGGFGDAYGPIPKNLVVALGELVVRAIRIAPGKLGNNSDGRGERYWVGVGPDATGFVERMGRCVADMDDAILQNGEAHAFQEKACRDSMKTLLKVMAVSAGGTAVHASRSLRYMCHSGLSFVSLERALAELHRFQDAITAPLSAGLAPVSDSDITFLVGLLEVLSNCTSSLGGRINQMVGRGALDLGPRAYALAIQNVPSRLRASLVGMLAAGDRSHGLQFLEDAGKDKGAKLRQMIRDQEAELGVYDATVAVLELAKDSCSWPENSFSSFVLEGVAVFAVEDVIAHWSQRRYATEFERWRLIRCAGELLVAIVSRDEPQQRDGCEVGLAHRTFSKLLCPAPGTGAACPALRALVSCVGLRRSSDDGMFLSNGSASIAQKTGRSALEQASSMGDGKSVREMEKAIAACARALLFTLSLSPSDFSSHLMVTARASDLLLSEPKAIVDAGKLVFTADDCTPTPSPLRMGYSSSTCGAVLGMLASAASQSTLICRLLTRTDQSNDSSSFRCSVADVIASYSFANSICETRDENVREIVVGRGDEDADSDDDEDNDGQLNFGLDRPRMQSALDLVEACLGMDGSGKPGLYLLGLIFGAGDRLLNSEYGVLSALMELVSGTGRGPYNRVDDSSRAHAAIFLERLAGNTTAVTSSAVLEFIRSVGVCHSGAEASNGGMDSRGFGDAMLTRIVSFERIAATDTNWNSLGELAGACMKISALLVRQFPSVEEASLGVVDQRSNLVLANSPLDSSDICPPPPDVLLRLCARVAGNGKLAVGVEAFRNWHQLLSARLSVHPPGRGYGSIPLLLDVAIALLNSLDSTDTSSDMNLLSSDDGGAQAASVILRCLGHIAQFAVSYASGHDDFLGDSQALMLLTKVVRAIAGRAEGRGDVAQTRTSLYAAFLVCCQLSEAKAMGSNISQAFSGRMGSRQTNGAEALVAIACEDAISGPAAATRAAAMVSLSVAVSVDPLRVLPALSAQNRLRRVVAAAVGDPSSQSRIVRSCARVSVEDDKTATEKAAVVVAESALSLIHAVAGAGEGVRALSDAACLDSVASLLEALAAPRHRLYGDESIDRDIARVRKSRGKPDSRSRYGDQGDSDMEDNDDAEMIEGSSTAEAEESPEERCAGIAGILTAAVAAAVVGSDSILIDGALATLHAGEVLYARIIRALSRHQKSHLTAVSHLAMVLSRIPPRILSDGAVPTQLRSLLACHVGCLVPTQGYECVIGRSGSPFSAGLGRVVPRDRRDARRAQTDHPEGGSLFERDLIAARIECLKCVFAALRPPIGLLSFFLPRFSAGTGRQDIDDLDFHQAGFLDEVSGRQGDLGDILRIARAALDSMSFHAEESIQLGDFVAEESPESLSSQQLASINSFCLEELDLGGGDEDRIAAEVAFGCLRDAASHSRQQADACVTILESALFILREYTSAASETLRGHDARTAAGDECPMTVSDAEFLLEDAKKLLLPLCRDLDALSGAVWGKQDSSFSRQLGRQIRTNLSPSR